MKRSTAALLTGLIAVAAGIMLIVFIAKISAKPGSKANLGGSGVYRAGKVTPLAQHITDGGPVFNRALTSGGPDIYIQHLGSDPTTGWHVFDVRTPGADRKCTLLWKAAQQQFVDPCTQRAYPADGAGMRAYKTAVVGNQLTVDFRASP